VRAWHGDEAAEAIAAFGPDRTLTAQADFVLKFGERRWHESHSTTGV
jgi:hypothetical protein